VSLEALRTRVLATLAAPNAAAAPVEDVPRCPYCGRQCRPGSRRRLRGRWWCAPCAFGRAQKMQNHCTGTIALVTYHNAEEARRERHGVWSEPPPRARIQLGSPDVERDAIVRFVEAAANDDIFSRSLGKGAYWRDVGERVYAIARGIDEEALDPETAIERMRILARTTGDDRLSTRLYALIKGIRHGKHRATAVRVAAPPPRVRVDAEVVEEGDDDAALEAAEEEASATAGATRRRAGEDG